MTGRKSPGSRDAEHGFEEHECAFLIGSRVTKVVEIDAALQDFAHLRAFRSRLDAAELREYERVVAPFAALDARCEA